MQKYKDDLTTGPIPTQSISSRDLAANRGSESNNLHLHLHHHPCATHTSSTITTHLHHHIMFASTMQRVCTRRSTVAGVKFMSSAAVQEATSVVASKPGHSMPPGFTASVGNFQTFMLPDKVTKCRGHIEMGIDMINAWRRDGIIQVAMTDAQQKTYQAADASSRRFFGRTPSEKVKCVDSNSYSGYVGSGEEITNGIADYSEIFTVTKDLAEDDPRTAAKWPCHGPCPWPDQGMKKGIGKYMGDLGQHGDKILQLIELGLDVPEGSLTNYADDGWHHMRILR
jgi:hypothetical protein